MILKQNYLLVEHKEETKSKGGIILTVQSQAKTLLGVIKKVGDAVDVEGLEEGQTVYYDRLNASTIEILGTEYDIIEDTDVIAVLEEGDSI